MVELGILLVLILTIPGLVFGIVMVLRGRWHLWIKLWIAISIAIAAAVMLVPGGYILLLFVVNKPMGVFEESAPAEPPLASPAGTPVLKIPQFPWPPPKASAFEVIPRKLLVPDNQSVLLDDVSVSLDKAFRECGYGDKSYFAVPDGFAIASRIEQINPDGTFAADRWSLNTSYIKEFSLIAYLRALFTAGKRGHYRIIVFVVSPHPFAQNNVEVSEREARKWVEAGLNQLPAEIGSHEYSSDYNCTALIYEFQRVENQPARFVEPSEMTGRLHLEKAGLLAALSKHR